MFYYINIFFIYSFLGFLFENIVSVFLNSNFNSGILYGPWTFIYAFAIFMMMFLNKILKKFKLDKWLEIVLFYIFVTIFMTFIEFSGGMLIEILFHKVYWDYTNLAYNLGRYISLEVALFWGFFATIVNYLLVPLLDRLARIIPKYFSILLVIFFIIDVIATIMN